MMGIGFDTTNPLDKHWIAQNSYGSSWGDGGIGKVRFNSLITGDDKKVCRILPLTRACWPLFEPPSSKKRARLPTISTKVADNPVKRRYVLKESVRRSDRIKDRDAQKASVKPSTVQERRGQSVMDAAGPFTLADTSNKIKKGRKREATPLLPTAPAILDYATDAVGKKQGIKFKEGECGFFMGERSTNI
ncbi:Long chain acyl-CoA synthetase 9, chloroplastic [Orobanche minor]